MTMIQNRDFLRLINKIDFPGGFSMHSILPSEARPDLLRLYDNSSEYFKLVSGQIANASDVDNLFESLPTGKSIEDKFVIGIANNDRSMIGVIDLIRDYPRKHCWCLGLMLLDPAVRNRGLGSLIYYRLEEKIKCVGGEEMRLVVHEKNILAQHFWQSQGFSITGTGSENYSGTEVKVHILEKKIQLLSDYHDSCQHRLNKD